LLRQPALRDKILSLSSNSQNKSTNSSAIQIDTSFVKIIETNQYDSYTFQVVQDSIEKQFVLRNYILTVVNDSTYVQHLVDYTVLSGHAYDMDHISLTQVFGDDLLPSFIKCSSTITIPYTSCYMVHCNRPGQHTDPEDLDCSAEIRAYEMCVTRWLFLEAGDSACSGGDSDGVIDDSGTRNSSGGSLSDDLVIPVEPNDGREVRPLVTVSDTTQAFFNTLNNPTEIALYNFIQNFHQNELRREINDYLRSGLNSQEAQDFVKWLIDFAIIKEDPTPCGWNSNHDCLVSINRMAQGLRRFHGAQGAEVAAYFESVLSDINTSPSEYTVNDIQEIYNVALNITKQYNSRMIHSIVVGFVDGVTPIIEIALFEVGGIIAVRLLQRIPLSWVLRGDRLNNLVRKVGLMGEVGAQNSIRIVKTNAPIANSRGIFNTLTKNKIGNFVTGSNGSISANMGNGNFIIYRPVTASTSNFPATISLDFRAGGIWTQVRNVKFITP
jgi:hypothetical protein